MNFTAHYLGDGRTTLGRCCPTGLGEDGPADPVDYVDSVAYLVVGCFLLGSALLLRSRFNPVKNAILLDSQLSDLFNQNGEWLFVVVAHAEGRKKLSEWEDLPSMRNVLFF